MATAEHIKNLIMAHIEGNENRFKTVILQIAAYEAKHNHDVLAHELKKCADKIGKKHNNVVRINVKNPILMLSNSTHELSDLIVSDNIKDKINRILLEYKNKSKLSRYGLSNRRKILLEGEPGTGKTLTASVIASELRLSLYIVQMDKLVTKFMGETSTKLRQIFDEIEEVQGVYFFDEFDAIGADRSLDNEVGEMRRILNSFLQFIEQDSSESIIIAATNHSGLLDKALFRRFDDVLHYALPGEQEIVSLIRYKMGTLLKGEGISCDVINAAMGLSHSEIIKACDDVIKEVILYNKNFDMKNLLSSLNNRKVVYSTKGEHGYA